MTAFVPLVLTWVFGADLLEKMADTKPEIKTTDAAAEGIDVDDQPDTYTHAHIHTHSHHTCRQTHINTHMDTHTHRETLLQTDSRVENTT
jgi:hypothetical protein